MRLYQLVTCNPEERETVDDFVAQTGSVILRNGPYQVTDQDPEGDFCELGWFEGCTVHTVGSFHSLEQIQEHLPELPSLELSG